MGNTSNMGGFMTQFPTKKEIATWRQEEIVVPALGLKTVHFNDTKPNMFYMQNTNDVYLLLGITKIPSEESYEYRVEKNNSRTFGRPVPTNTLHILNPANKDITVTLFSVNAPFDIAVLQNFFFDADVIKSVAFDGIIKGFSNNVPLPSGNNHLGSVDIEALPEGYKHIGEVSLPEETEETFGEIVTGINNVLSTAKEINNKVIDFLYFERESVTEAVEIDFNAESFKPNYIHFISNDGESSDIVVTLTMTSGASKTFRLLGGDILGDIKVYVTKIKIEPRNTSSAISWRCLFGRRV